SPLVRTRRLFSALLDPAGLVHCSRLPHPSRPSQPVVARAESASEFADRTSPENRLLRPFLALLSFVLLVCVGIFVVKTWHWPMIGDAALLHYGVFLMEH